MDYSIRCERVANCLHAAWRFDCIAIRTADADWFRHVYRELNGTADALVNQAMNTKTSLVYCCEALDSLPPYLRGCFDGGKRPDEELSACGWQVDAAWQCCDNGQPVWEQLAYGSVQLTPETTVVDAELQGLEQVVAALCSLALTGHIKFENFRVVYTAQRV